MSDDHSGINWSKWHIAIASLGLGVTVTAAIGGYWLWWYRKKRSTVPLIDEDIPLVSIDDTVQQLQEEDTTVASAVCYNTMRCNIAFLLQSLVEKARDIKVRGNNLFKEKDFEGAIKCYQEALDCCPDNEVDDIAAFHHNIAASYENMVKYSCVNLILKCY